MLDVEGKMVNLRLPVVQDAADRLFGWIIQDDGDGIAIMQSSCGVYYMSFRGSTVEVHINEYFVVTSPVIPAMTFHLMRTNGEFVFRASASIITNAVLAAGAALIAGAALSASDAFAAAPADEAAPADGDCRSDCDRDCDAAPSDRDCDAAPSGSDCDAAPSGNIGGIPDAVEVVEDVGCGIPPLLRAHVDLCHERGITICLYCELGANVKYGRGGNLAGIICPSCAALASHAFPCEGYDGHCEFGLKRFVNPLGQPAPVCTGCYGAAKTARAAPARPAPAAKAAAAPAAKAAAAPAPIPGMAGVRRRGRRGGRGRAAAPPAKA
jgi:hypothetical protein